MVKFKKILIANRGEIAVRIMRTCKELGIETVAVYSTEDQESMHVKLADDSVCVGPAHSMKSYLNSESILSAAIIKKVDAIHPGFGFLSENAKFALKCMEENIAFIGPSATCIEQMGDKILSKQIAVKAGLPVLSAIYLVDKSDDEILGEVRSLGLPVLIKSSAGGGGRGMKCIEDENDLFTSIERLKQEAKAAFGDDTLFIEKYIERPRHVEVQVVADKHGNVIHIGERDCTIQRRYQKVLEESPCPVIDDQLREQICESAVNLAKFVNYDSVGTVEFLLDQAENKFYFMEMNTRIQVEHPVTEMRANIDLIAKQIKIAQNELLDCGQDDIQLSGHSIECRINAEDPDSGAPGPGKIVKYARPKGEGVRVDDFIYSGYQVSHFYDSMLAKLIVHAPTRAECLQKLNLCLKNFVIEGISTNIDLHKRIINSPDFVGNNYATNFLKVNLK
ncbi:MAG: acetyl-CoA carboxylase biotin carboxylase subunit [Bacteriovoracaceae bacterium]|nr:acetyl-CoA carboxylase biotin carboxylase subunit [Bacteriovoracaceae bacterium]